MKAFFLSGSLIFLAAFMHQRHCTPSLERAKRSPQIFNPKDPKILKEKQHKAVIIYAVGGGWIEYTEDWEAKTVDMQLDEQLASPGEFHKLEQGDVTFELVTRENRNGVILDPATINQVQNKKTIISIAGWYHNTTASTSYFIQLTEEYLKKGDYNVILVHADKLMFYPQPVSASYTVPIGNEVAGLIIALNTDSGVAYSKIHIVGHALGAHIAGAAGRKVQNSGGKIYRISALEVSSIGFEDAGPNQRLDKKDAEVVDVYHTAAGQAGLNKSVGSIDFWPNGGIAPQPHCPLYPNPPAQSFEQLSDVAYCSHDQSIWYYIYTINTKDVLGRKCSSYEKFLRGQCAGHPVSYYGDNYGGIHKGNDYLILDCTSAASCVSIY